VMLRRAASLLESYGDDPGTVPVPGVVVVG